MANEISFSFSLSVNKPGVMNTPAGLALAGLSFTMSGTTFVHDSILFATSATVVPLGSVTQPHVAIFSNLDSTNYFTLFNGASGAVLCRFLAGETYPIPLEPTCVPYIQANTAAVQVEYWIFSL